MLSAIILLWLKRLEYSPPAIIIGGMEKYRQKRVKPLVKAHLPFFLFLACCPTPALAYIDPGTGSFLIQVLVGAFVTVAASVRLFWHQINSKILFIKNKITKNSDKNNPGDPT